METGLDANGMCAGGQPGRGPSQYRLLAKWIDFCVAVTVWAVVEFVLVRMVPVFAEIFTQFGGRLPAPTRFVVLLNGFPGSLIVPILLACLVVFQFWRTIYMPPPMPGDSRLPWDRKVVLALILLGVFTFIFAVVSLYLPLFTIGEEIAK
jgi:hypothetical protein